MTDTDKPDDYAFFNNRLSKLLSIIPATAAAFFNKAHLRYVYENKNALALVDAIHSDLQFEFDAKAWTVPDKADVYKWFLHRQNDCLRNSKQQTAQTYLNHRVLESKTSDEQIELLRTECGVDWQSYPDSVRQGRLIYKTTRTLTNDNGIEYERSTWMVTPAWLLNTLEGKEKFIDLITVNQEEK